TICQDRVTQPGQDNLMENILKTLTTLCTKVDSMGLRIQKLEENIESTSQQHDYKHAELRRSTDEKQPELEGDDGKLQKTHNKDGPSQLRRTVVRFRCKTLQLLRIWYWERVSERHDGSAGCTVTGVTDRHRILSEKWSLRCCNDLRDGPSQARRAVTGCVIPVGVGFLVKF
ncbi:hypothetical protein EJD97_021468, partial [Solanum chilense]